MPPKKPPTNKKDDKQDNLDDPVPKNECQFKIIFETKQEAGHYFKLKYDWISVQGQDQIDFQKHDTGFFRDWTLIKIEGEEPKPPEQETAPTGGAKGAAAKKPAAQAKPDPKKGGALEEITDNRPRQITHIKDFGVELGGNGLKITEEVAKRFAETYMKIDVIEVNRETQEETIRDTIQIDLSCLLFPRTKLDFNWNFDKLKPMQIHYLSVTIQSEQHMLSDFLRKKLNPLQINLVACKDIPSKTDHKFKPIYCILKFVDGREFKTLEFPQQPFIKFMHRHVFLVGPQDQVQLKELFSTQLVKVDLHDCDEYVPPEDEKDAKFSVGCAKFTLKDFLRPNCKELKLRSDIFPVKREQQDNTQNLDLNTTARKNERGIEKASPYLINATYCVIVAELAFPIGTFNEEAELRLLRPVQEELPPTTTSAIDPKGSTLTQKQGQQPPQAQQQQQQQVNPTQSQLANIKSSEHLMSAQSLRSGIMSPSGARKTQEGFNEQDAIYERAILIIPYRSPDTVKQIEAAFENINMQGLGVDNIRYLNTKEFSEEERKNRKLDIIGGFELMDAECRIYVIEGLGGEGRGMNKFYIENQRQRPNDKKFKLLYNPEVRFKNRLYLDFNVQIKKIKLRDTLTKIMGSPDVYLRSKVPEDIYDTLQKFAEMRKLDRMTLVRDFNLFPQTDKLLNLERKYGDSLSYEDLYGLKSKPKRKRMGDETLSVNFADDTIAGKSVTALSHMTGSQYNDRKAATTDGFNQNSQHQSAMKSKPTFQRNRTIHKGETEAKNHDFEETLKIRKEAPPKDFKQQQIEKIQSMSVGRPPKERMNIPEGVEVFMYGNQKLNIWEFQKEQLRKQIANDPKNFYTYSKDFLTLAFPLINENEIKMKEKEENETKWKTKNGFDQLVKKTNYAEHPKKPPQCIVDDLTIPYVQQMKEKMEAMKGRQPFIADDGKPDFQKNFRVPPSFSDREFFNTVFISGDDMVKEQQQLMQKELETWKSKVVVGNPHFQVNTIQHKKIGQVEKHRNLLEDPPKKIGLRLSNSRLKQIAERQIMVTKHIENIPSTIFDKAKYIDPLKTLPKLKEKDPTMMTGGSRDFNTNIRNDVISGSPKSKKVFIQPLSAQEKTGAKWGSTE